MRGLEGNHLFRSSWRRLAVLLWLTELAAGHSWGQVAAQATPEAQRSSLHGHVEDENGLPVAAVEVVVLSADGKTYMASSDAAGNFEVANLSLGLYHSSLAKPGFFLLRDVAVELNQGSNDISFVLNHEYEVHESVKVVGAAQQVSPEQTDQRESLQAHDIVNLPLPRTHDLMTYLPSMPGVLRDNSGGLHVAGGRAQQTEYLLDGFEIADPATGQLTSRLNVDAVRSADVDSGGYGAQYAHGGSAVLALNTPTGDDHWRFGTTNFIPGVSFERGLNLGNWYPRFSFSGPVRPGRAWFSDAVSLQHTFSAVSGLPKTADTTTQWAGDNLLRVQFNHTQAHSPDRFSRQSARRLQTRLECPIAAFDYYRQACRALFCLAQRSDRVSWRPARTWHSFRQREQPDAAPRDSALCRLALGSIGELL